jgi:protein-S-isoprenylcysteine O-methyltransferase Ste14
MSDDQLFRNALIAGFVVILPLILYFRIRSNIPREPLDRWQEGRLILFTLRPAGFVFMFGLLMYAVDPERMAWSSMPLPRLARWIGVGLYAVSAGGLLWTLRNLGPNFTDTVVTRRAHTLVTQGPYRWVRHPFYACIALLALASTLAAANWFLALASVTFLSLLVLRARIEEEKLIERFGDGYRAYMQQTGRFWPTSFPSSSRHTTKAL